MFSDNNKISKRQLKMLVILNIFGSGIIAVPQTACYFGLNDGWICVLISGLIMLLSAFLVMTSTKPFAGQDFSKITERLFGRIISAVLCIIFAAKIIFSTSFALGIFSNTIKSTILNEMPVQVISIVMLILCAYCAYEGYEARGRLAELLVFAVFIPLIVIFAAAIKDSDFSNIKPILVSNTPQNIIMGSLAAGLCVIGVEFLFFINPYINRPRPEKPVYKGIIFAFTAFALILFITTARFGRYDMAHQSRSVIEIMNTIDIPGSFIERQDALMMWFYVVSSFVIINAGFFFGTLLLRDVIRKGSHGVYILAFIPAVFLISLIFSDTGKLLRIMISLNIAFSFAYTIILPVIMIILGKAVKRNENN